jgi:hypothetical protein
MIHTVEVTKLILKEHEYKLEPEAALDLFRASHTYECLMDDESGLYDQSDLYIYSLYKEEQQGWKQLQ